MNANNNNNNDALAFLGIPRFNPSFTPEVSAPQVFTPEDEENLDEIENDINEYVKAKLEAEFGVVIDPEDNPIYEQFYDQEEGEEEENFYAYYAAMDHLDELQDTDPNWFIEDDESHNARFEIKFRSAAFSRCTPEDTQNNNC